MKDLINKNTTSTHLSQKYKKEEIHTGAINDHQPQVGVQHITKEFLSSVQALSERLLQQLQNQDLTKEVSVQVAQDIPTWEISSDILVSGNINALKSAICKVLEALFSKSVLSGFVIETAGEDNMPLLFEIEEFKEAQYANAYGMNSKIKITDTAWLKMRSGDGAVVLNPIDFNGGEGELFSEKSYEEMGVKTILGVALETGVKPVGFLYVFLKQNPVITRKWLDQLNFIGMQVSPVLASLLATSALERSDREKTALLSLAADMALVRSSDELAWVFSRKFVKVLRVRSYKVFYYHNDSARWNHFLSGPRSVANGEHAMPVVAADLRVQEEILNLIRDSRAPYSWNVNGEEELSTVSGQDEYWRSLGFDHVSGYPLRIKGESVGVIFIELVSRKQFAEIKPVLLTDLLSQVSIAVANVREIEEAEIREREKSKLLSFGEGIATARDKAGLSVLIKPYLIKIFGIKEFIITLKNRDQISYSYFLHGLESEEPVDLGPNFRQYSEIPEKGSLIEQVMLSEEPVTFELAQLIRSGALWKYVGATHAMGARLKIGNKDVGILWTQPNQISNFLLKGISAQIAIAVENVTANEEIIKKEKEREALLSLNTALAMVRNSDDLQRIINNRLKQFLSCSHAVIGKINEDGVTATVYLVDPDSKIRENPAYQSIVGQLHEVNDGLMDRAALSSAPVFFNLQEIVENGNAPQYAKLNYENGLNGLVVTRLLSGNKLFGFWMVFFEEDTVGRDKLEMIESLANQICIAITHVLINEEIQRREAEKSMLLEFSTAIASVREPEVFARVLRSQLRLLFEIEDYIIYSLHGNKQYYSPLLFHQDHIYANEPEFRKQVDAENDINDGVFNLTLASSDPVIHDVDQIISAGHAPAYITVAKAYNVKKIVGVALKVGTESVGVMNFQLTDANRDHISGNMFRSICGLLAIAIENIVSKEKVIRQLQEIDNYKQQLEEEQIYLKEELQTNQNYGEIIGESLQMRDTFRMITQVASSDSTVLILGETGTGKELVARAIHNNSPRRNKLMVKVNCAALPANLIESELFGHERGSFTGAIERRIGKFELANNGTLFLDEIGEMPLELQVKLLRAIQEKEIERIGGKGVIKVNVRIIAATNRDLEKEMDEGRFRSDLYYRLNIFPIHLAPLRERREDIPLLARHFINRYTKKTGKKINVVSGKVLQELSRYSWPGNIRELEHLLERSVLLAQGDTLRQVDLPREKTNEAGQTLNGEVVIKTIEENERDHIMQMLKHCGGRIAGSNGAAHLLGVPPSTLNSKLKKLGIRKGFRSADNDTQGE